MLDIKCPAATDNGYKKSGRKRSGRKIFEKKKKYVDNNVIINMNSYL